MRVKELIVDYLKEAKLMQIATARDNQPWACTVYFAFDQDLNLYWISKPTTRHSAEIRENVNVAGTVVLPHPYGVEVRGIQFQGTAKELTIRDEAIVGMKYYVDRFDLSKDRVEAILEGKDDHLCYKITPSLYVLFDTLNFPDDPRQEYKVLK